MELNFPKSDCKYLAAACRDVQNQELTQEIRLSEGMPDVGRVLSSWGQVVLRSKEWRSDEISFSGGVMAWVLYAPEDGTQPRCIESWIPFQMKWDIPGQRHEGDIRVRCLLRFADARSVSARKIMLRLGIGAMGEAWTTQEAELSAAEELPEDVQLLKTTYPVRLPKEAGEKSFLLDEDIVLPGSCPRPEKLIYYTMTPVSADHKVMGNKVVFRGNGNLSVLYCSEEGQLYGWNVELPFSQFADLNESYSADARTDIQMCVTSLEAELDDESHLRVKCGLLAQYLVDDREMLELPEDAYSTKRALTAKLETLELPAILEQKTQMIPVQQEIHQSAHTIVDTVFLPDFPVHRRTGEEIQWEMPGQFQILYYDHAGILQSGTARWEGHMQLRADETSRVTAVPMPVQQLQAAAGSDSIRLNAELPMMQETQSGKGFQMITGLELEQPEESAAGRPSVILCRAGEDRLWDIAKRTGSTVEAIKAANALESDPAANQILLIPVS